MLETIQVHQLSPDDITVETLTELIRLYGQLTKKGETNRSRLELCAQQGFLLVARSTTDDKIVGTAFLATILTPLGLIATVEDVVVDQSVRRCGIGRAMMERLIKEATRVRAVWIDLTSSSSRTAAHQLYQSLGFILRETNVYRLKLANGI